MISVIAMMMVVGLMVSCDNANISPELKAEELVSVSFDEGASRGLTGSIEAFSKGNYYWKYAAQKADASGLISGQTPSYDESGAVWIKKGTGTKSSGKGLDNSINGFSQGFWNFTLYAYTDDDGNNLAYSGEITGQKLQKSETGNTVVVRVAPIATGNGTLKVDTANIRFVPKQNSALTAEQLASLSKVVTVQKWENGGPTGSPETNPAPVNGSLSYSLSAGTYKVTVKFVRNDGITYSEGYAIVTVYSNVTTIVSGYLDEFTTEAVFDSDAEVINKVAIFTLNNVTDINASITDNVTLVDTSEESNRKVEAVVMQDDARKQLSDAVNNSVYKNEVATSRTAELQLKVDTTSATENTVTLEIGMSSVVRTTISSSEGSDSVVYTETSAIKSLDKYVTVKVQMQKYLSNVAVTHNGHDMVSSESTTADQ